METSREDLQLLTRVAWLYYKQGMTQRQIAQHLQMTRARVIRLLQAARAEGVVRINIAGPYYNCLELEQDLKEVFGLSDAMVVPVQDGSNEALVRESLGKAGAQYLESRLNTGDLLAVGWGRTTYEVARSMQGNGIRALRIVTLQGGLTPSYYMNRYEVGAKLAEVFQGECYYIHAPVLAGEEKLAQSFYSDITVRQALEMIEHAHYSLVSIGKPTTESTLVQMRYLSPAEITSLCQQGAVGDMLVQFFDIEGHKVQSELHRRIVAFAIEKLRDMDNVIGVAGGEGKVASILGALRGGYIKVLITDESTGFALLERERANGFPDRETPAM